MGPQIGPGDPVGLGTPKARADVPRVSGHMDVQLNSWGPCRLGHVIEIAAHGRLALWVTF